MTGHPKMIVLKFFQALGAKVNVTSPGLKP
jgi:hypothetical protein